MEEDLQVQCSSCQDIGWVHEDLEDLLLADGFPSKVMLPSAQAKWQNIQNLIQCNPMSKRESGGNSKGVVEAMVLI